MTGQSSNCAPLSEPRGERLLALLWRRATLGLYRRSPRGMREQVRADEAAPPMSEVLAVWLAERLPSRVVCRLDTGGLFRLARLLCRVLSVGAALASVGFWVCRGLFRLARGAKRLVAPPRTARGGEQCFIEHSPVENANILIGGRVLLRGHVFEGDVLTCFFEAVARVPHECQIFVHLYPESASSLPPDRLAYGCLCKDHNPLVPFTQWPRGRVCADRTALADVPEGFYRVRIGLVDLATVQRVPVEGEPDASIDLGWVRIGTTVCSEPTGRKQGA